MILIMTLQETLYEVRWLLYKAVVLVAGVKGIACVKYLQVVNLVDTHDNGCQVGDKGSGPGDAVR